MWMPWKLLIILKAATECASASTKPNIVFIMVDDVGWADFSYSNEGTAFSTVIPTPHIDALASRGIKLKNYYVHPSCTPTRAAFLTGLYSPNTGLTVAMMPATTAGLPAEINTLPKLLRVAGYKAHMVGKWHLGNSRWCQTPVGRGFNSFTGAMLSHIDSYTKEMFSPNGIPIAIDWVRSFENKSLFYEQDLRHATIAITSEAENIIRKHEESSPLFLYVAFTAGHAPLQPLPEHISKCSHISHLWRREFCGMIVGLDDGISNISNTVEQYNSNTVLVVSSDNGGSTWFGGMNEPFRGGKTSPFEGGVHVPAFVLDFSGIYFGAGGRWYDGLMHVSDWFPTFAHLAQLPLPTGLDGIDMVDALRYSLRSTRTNILVDMYYQGDTMWATEFVVALRKGPFKLIHGIPHDPIWYFESTSKFMNTSSSGWNILLGEAIVRGLEAVIGVSQFDTFRTVLVFAFLQGSFLKDGRGRLVERTLLFNLDDDPSETIDVSANFPELTEELLIEAEKIKTNRPKQQQFWMIDMNWTFGTGSCASSTKCRFIHPWISEEDDVQSIVLEHVKVVAFSRMRAAAMYHFGISVTVFGLLVSSVIFACNSKTVHDRKKYLQDSNVTKQGPV